MTSKNILIALLVLISIVCSGLVVYLWQTMQINNLSYQWQLEKALLEKQISDLQQQLVVQDDNVEQDDSKDEAWTQYSLDKYGLVFEYPENYSVTETDHYLAPTIKIVSPDFSSELVGSPLRAIIIGSSFYLETWTSTVDIDLDTIINDRLNSSGQMTVPDQDHITKQRLGKSEFGLYTVNGYDEALFYDDMNNRGWKVVFETEDPRESHQMFINFLQGIEMIEIDKTKDWLTYKNSKYGYEIKYPVDTKLDTSNVKCVSLQYVDNNKILGYVLIGSPDVFDDGGYCGRTGYGYDIISVSQDITIGGTKYTFNGYQEKGPGETLQFHNETFILYLPDNTRIEFSSSSDDTTTFDYYNKNVKPVLIKMLESFKQQ
ncbi:hypothetical protein ACFL2U_02725 [Patescibacteria group bacterium]